MKYLIALLPFIFAGYASADVFKCTIDGKTVYQEAPCATGAGGKVDMKYQYIPSDPDAEGMPEELRKRFENLISQKRIVVGMTAKMVQQSWGKPEKINYSHGVYGRHEQWVYERGAASSDYVYIENGLLKSFQTSR